MSARLVRLREAYTVFELVHKGASVPEIAAVLDLPEKRIRRIIAAHERKLELGIAERLEVHREIHMGRLEDLLAAVWPRATKSSIQVNGEERGPSMECVDRALKILSRQSRLLGLDAPARAELKTTSEVTVNGRVSLASLSTAELEAAEVALERTLKVVSGGA